MKYYFTAQTNGISSDTRKRYQDINSMLSKRGHVNTNYVHMDDNKEQRIKAIETIESGKISHFDYQADVLRNSDAVICDMTEPSATVGYQIYYAISKKIPVLALYFTKGDVNSDYVPTVIFTGNNNGLLKLAKVEYIKDIDSVIDSFEKNYVQKPFKFNFLIPLDLYNGLNRVASNQGKTKSELMRGAVEKLIEASNDDNNIIDELDL